MILPRAARDHVRRDVAHHQPGPAHVDRHHPIPQVRIPFVEVSGMELGIKRRVVDQDVDLAEAVDGLRHQGLDRRLVADVERAAGHGVGAMPARNLRGERRAVLDIGDHHARAFGGERQRIMPADALGAAGDDRGLSFKPCHGRSPDVLV